MSKVYVLGAGASTEYRSHCLPVPNPPVPTDKTFWSTLEKIILRSSEGPKINNSEYIDYESITSFLKARYKVPKLGMLDRLGLENIFSDLAEERPVQLRTFVRLLSWALFQTIRAIDERTAPIHYRFVQEKISPGDTIITFNYDVIIEQVIWNCARKTPNSLLWHPSTGYHLNFSGYLNAKEPQGEPSPLETSPSNVFICKLHGSTGWLSGEPGNNANIVYLFLSGKSEDARLMGEGFLPRGPIIVPPIQRKEFPPILEPVWQKAEEVLLEANEVYLVGYRIPEIDREAKKLFEKTCNNKHVELVLKGHRSKDETQRLRQLFPNLKPDSFIDRSFSEWVRS
jgi:hypothetical protein